MVDTLDNILFDDKIEEKAYKLLIKRLVNRDYTRFELTTYLNNKIEISPTQIENVLDLLEKQRYVDDVRYMEEKTEFLRNQLRGNTRILKDLVKRGLNEQEVLAYLESEDQSEYYERAKTRAIKYFRRNKQGSKLQRKNKCKAHLIQQGYEFSVVDEVLNETLDPLTKDEEKNSLSKAIMQSSRRYQRRFEGYELKQKIIQNALSKGYTYESIKEVMEELDEQKD